MTTTPWKPASQMELEAVDRTALAQQLEDLEAEVLSKLEAIASVITAKKAAFEAANAARNVALMEARQAEAEERGIRNDHSRRRGDIERMLRITAPKEIDEFRSWALDQQADRVMTPVVSSALVVLDALRLEPDEGVVQRRLQELEAAITAGRKS